MTQSGGGPTPEEFVVRLADRTALSGREIARQARAIGLRISNERVGTLVKAARRAELTRRQSQVLLTIDTPNLRRTGLQIADQVADAAENLRDRARVRIRYRVTAEASFQYEGGGEASAMPTLTLEREVTIRFNQLRRFQERIEEFAETHVRALLDEGARVFAGLLADPSGNVILNDQPQVRILETTPILAQ